MNATFDLCDFVKDKESYPGYYAAYDNRTRGNFETPNDATNYTFYFNVAANVALQVPDTVCDDYSDGTHTGYCSNIASADLYNATCKEFTQIKQMVGAYQAKKETGSYSL